MSNIPSDLKYTKSHEWVKDNGDGTVTVGITDHAQDALGEIVFLELPGEGDKLSAGDSCAVVESVKAASDIYAPVSGEVLAVNGVLSEAPEKINDDAYAAWLFKLRVDDAGELDALLSAEAYARESAD